MFRKSVRFFSLEKIFKRLILFFFLIQASCGCLTNQVGVNNGGLSLDLSGDGDVDSIRLFTSPSVLNLDNKPGVDGFTAKIYALDQDMPKPIKVNKGEIEFLLYESTIDGDPLQIWKFNSKKLKKHMLTTQIGVVYDFRLLWDPANAPKRKAAILAQYRSVDGKLIKAVPVVLPITK